MRNTKNEEGTLIRSKVLVVLFSMLISALILLPLFSQANDRSKTAKTAEVYMKPLEKEYQVSVKILTFEEGRNHITIESIKGETLFYDQTFKANEPFSKVFDFSNLADGEYTLKVKSKSGITKQNFEIKNGAVIVYDEEAATPAYNQYGEKAFFELENSNNDNYSIEVYDELGNLLIQTDDNRSNIKKVLNFSQVESGKYKILVSSNRSTYAFNYEK